MGGYLAEKTLVEESVTAEPGNLSKALAYGERNAQRRAKLQKSKATIAEARPTGHPIPACMVDSK